MVAGEGTRDVMLVEYEQSVRPNTMLDKFEGYLAFWQSQAWKKPYAGLTEPPTIVISVSSTADRQSYWANPYDHVCPMAAAYPVLYPHGYLIDETAWRNGLGAVRPIGPLGASRRGLHELWTPPLPATAKAPNS